MNYFADERYSVCIVHAESHSKNTYYKYFRVADYVPRENPNELIPALVEKDTTSFEEAQSNPNYLYNPSAARNYEHRESDFYFFQWKLNPSDSGKQLTQSLYDDTSLGAFREPREIFILEGDDGERGLRNALSRGIPFKGKTTSVFYIVYSDKNEMGLRPAIRCERRDFSFADGMIRPYVDISNVRKTVMSAPRVWLKDYHIIESPHVLTSHRKLYAKLEELESDGNVLLRSLDYYASDYVKWFIREESIHVSKSNRRAISQIIDAALSRPDALETYLEAGAQENEVQNLRKSIASIVMDKEDPDRALFRKALLEDEAFHRECVEQIIRTSDPILEERKDELAAAKSDIEKARSSLDGLNSSIDALNQRKQSLESDIKSLHSDLERVRREQDETLAEIQSNIALKLGLRAVSTQSPVTSSPKLVVEDGLPYDCTESNSSFEEALLNNLKQAGITSAFGRPADERKRLAAGLIGALTATRYIAVPQSVARQVADSISVAMSGRTAKKVVVPADYRDVASFSKAISGEDEVVIVEGIIDSVNEGMLFSLLSESVKPLVILSFMSHASAALVAKEIWGKVFLSNAENFLAYPSASKKTKLQHDASGSRLPNVRLDDALDEAHNLNEELEQLGLASEPLFLTAIVLNATEDLTDESNIEQCVAQHLLMCSNCDARSFQILDGWSEEDQGLHELAKKLGIYGL